MDPNTPSRTAERVALHRAAHQILEHGQVLRDPLAVPIIGSEAQAKLRSRLDWYAEPKQRLGRAFVVARSRFSDDALAAAIARGASAYVVLGAGLDTSAYRAARQFPALAMYEVDHPATQAWKRARLQQAEIDVPSGLRFVPIDFETDTLSDALVRAGFDASHPAQFSMLGVTPYLTHNAIVDTLRAVARLPKDSEVVFDYARTPADEERRVAIEEINTKLSAWGEPLRSQFDPEALEREVLDLGFSQVRNFDAATLGARYLRGMCDQLDLSDDFHIMRARV